MEAISVDKRIWELGEYNLCLYPPRGETAAETVRPSNQGRIGCGEAFAAKAE
jgi:hypothetical protein